jgi:hypothetical protein
MFGERIDGQITMLQRIVALLRDLILVVTVAITCVIVYFGGDSSKLTTLDWTKLVGAALFIVLGPVIIFILVRGLLSLFSFTIDALCYSLGAGTLPKGWFAWYYLRSQRRSKREYILRWRKHRLNAMQNAMRHLQDYESKIKSVRTLKRLDRIVVSIYPYLVAVMSLLFAVFVFRRLITAYIP